MLGAGSGSEPPALCLCQVRELDGHARGAPAHRCWWSGPEPESGQHGLCSFPRPRGQAEVWQVRPLSRPCWPGWAGVRAVLCYPVLSWAVSAPQSRFLPRRMAGVVRPCRPCLPRGAQLWACFSQAHWDSGPLQPCLGQACKPSAASGGKGPRSLPVPTSASSCPGPHGVHEDRAEGWPAVGSSGPGGWAVGAEGLASAPGLGLLSLGGQVELRAAECGERAWYGAEFTSQEAAASLVLRLPEPSADRGRGSSAIPGLRPRASGLSCGRLPCGGEES